MSFTLKSSGSWDKTEKWLRRLSRGDIFRSLQEIGRMGVANLALATPVETGETATSWSFEITQTRRGAKIEWSNSHVNEGVNVAILIQYGHGTGTGGWVQGYDYINPAMDPVYTRAIDLVMQEVKS